MRHRRIAAALAPVVIAAGACAPAQANENGVSNFPFGPTLFLANVLPPPGVYGVIEPQYYHSGYLAGLNGGKLPLDFKVDSYSVTPRVLYVTPTQLFGATLAFQGVLPIVDLTTSVFGRKTNVVGIADPQISPILNWDLGDKFFAALGVDIEPPLGAYNRNRATNIGTNYWTVALTGGPAYFDPNGFQASLEGHLIFNTTNPATEYHSGTALDLEYSAGYNIGQFRPGLTGYYYTQLQDDRVNGVKVGADGNRGEVVALGPTFTYSTQAYQVTGAWEHEFYAQNQSKGDTLIVQAGFRF